MKTSFFEGILEKKEGIIHLFVFWRIVLFPLFLIWFLFQLFAFSFIGGFFVILFSTVGMIGTFGSTNWKEDFLNDFYIFLSPFAAPIIWLIKYIYLGEFNTLWEE